MSPPPQFRISSRLPVSSTTFHCWGALQEDPKCLLSRNQEGLPEGVFYAHVAFGPDNIVAAAFGRDLHFLDAKYGAMLEHVEDAHEESITCLQWSPIKYDVGGRLLAVLATGSDDRKVRLWRAPVV